MGNHNFTMELIADKKLRYKTFKRREMGLKKRFLSCVRGVTSKHACSCTVPMEMALVFISLGFGRKNGTKLNVKKKKRTVNVYLLNKLFYFSGL